MLSLVAGKTLGVAKNIRPHIARLPRRVRSGGGFSPEDFVEMLDEINDRIPEDGSNHVLLLAHMWHREYFNRLKGDKTKGPLEVDGKAFDMSLGFEYRLHTVLEALLEKEVIVVTGSGNKKVSSIDGWPQNFGKLSNPLSLPQLIVVGGIPSREPTDIGYGAGVGQTDLAQGLPHVYAPGYDLIVAQGATHLRDNEADMMRPSRGTIDGESSLSPARVIE